MRYEVSVEKVKVYFHLHGVTCGYVSAVTFFGLGLVQSELSLREIPFPFFVLPSSTMVIHVQ
jgi:hypothetical protein